MYNIVKKLPVLGILLLVTSCGGGVEVDSIDKSYSTETVEVDAKIPQISGLSSGSLEETVNSEYVKTVSQLLEEFKKQAAKTGDKSTFTVTTTQHYNTGDFFSAVTQVDVCSQNAHKSSHRITKNIDTNRCIELSFSDLFEGEGYIDMINSRLEETVKGDGTKYAGLWEQPRLLENQDYYVAGNSLVLVYPPYKLSYYERGFVEIPLSLADMRGYLKEEYRHLADGKEGRM